MGTKALTVATVAAALFVVVIGADAAMNRTLTLEAQQAGGWREIGTSARDDGHSRPVALGSDRALQVNRSDEVRFRLTVDNGHLWASRESYVANVHGVEVARGEIAADARARGHVEFTVPAERLLQSPGMPPPGGPDAHFASLDVWSGDETVYALVSVQEVSR
jgi:hypothetical protein